MAGEVEFVDVWADNLEESFARLRAIVDDYPFVGMVRFFEHEGLCLLSAYSSIRTQSFLGSLPIPLATSVRANITIKCFAVTLIC